MGYEKQTFVDWELDDNGNVVKEGTTLAASHLQHIEEGIVANETAAANAATVAGEAKTAANEAKTAAENKQSPLVSGMNIKTINGQSILGSGDLEVAGGGDTSNLATQEQVAALVDSLSVERARIDQFVAMPEGATTNDAEVADIRVDYNGLSYTNAGNAVRGQAKNIASDVASMKKYFSSAFPTIIKKVEGFCLNTSNVLVEKSGYTTYYFAFRPQTLSIAYNVAPAVLDGSGNLANSNVSFVLYEDYTLAYKDSNYKYYAGTHRCYVKESMASKGYDPKANYILAISFADSSNVRIMEIAVDKSNLEGIDQSDIIRRPAFAKTKNLIDPQSFIGPFATAGEGYKFGSAVYLSNFFELDPTKPLFVNTNYSGRQMAVTVCLYDENLAAVKTGSSFSYVPNNAFYGSRINCQGLNIPVDYPTARYGVVSWAETKTAHTQADFEAIMVSQEFIEKSEPALGYIENVAPTEQTTAEMNKDMDLIVRAMANRNCNNSKSDKRLMFLITTDIHMDYPRMERAVAYANTVPSLQFVTALGDLAEGNGYTEDAAWWTRACGNSKLPVYPVIGNHDLGNNTKVAESTTVAPITEKWLNPIIGEDTNIDRPAGKSWYSRTFDDEKLVCLFLNSFDCPDTNDGTTYAVDRSMPCWSQEQINWLIQKLQAVPSGYGVALFFHQWGDDHVKADYAWNDPTGAFVKKATFTGLIPDIVNAWKNGGALNQTYTAKDINFNTINIDGSPYTITVDASFASRGNGIFVGHFTGHTHRDTIATSQTYTDQNLFGFTTTSAGTSYNMNDNNREPFTRNQDAITVVSISMNDKKVYFARIGNQMTRYLNDRKFAVVSF